MPRKRTARRKKTTGTRKKLGEYSEFEAEPLAQILYDQGSAQLSKDALSVNCRFCNTDLVHLNFEWPGVPTNTITLGTIKNAIRQRHGGSVLHIELYLNYAHPDHKIGDFSDGTTLAELGIKGEIPGAAEKLPDVTFYYDFPPETQFYDQPLVYMEPNVIKPLNGIPAATLKQRIVHGAKMRPGSWKAMETA